jgi:energy-coupling factor transport system substrate-specific component
MASSGSRVVPAAVPVTVAVTLVPLAAATNILGSYLAGLLKVPVFLDMIGTCVASIVLGPWWGALAGVLSNLGGALFNGPSNIPFALANVAGALVWGYGVRRFGMGRNGVTYFVLNLVVAVVVALVASPIVLFVYGGATGHSSDAITAALEITGQGLASAVVASNLVINVADKLIAGYVGLAIIRALPAQYLVGIRLPATSPLGTFAMAVVGIALGVALAAVYLALPH